MLLPRLKATMAALWTVGCEFEGAQRALGEAWFAMYPVIIELMLWYYSLINIVATLTHRRVSDVLFGSTVFPFALMHYYRVEIASSTLLNVDGRIAVVMRSEKFEQLNLVEMFSPSIALPMNGNIKLIFYVKLVVLALNLLPLGVSQSVSRSNKTSQSFAACEIEKTLALRACRIGGLGLSPIYATVPRLPGGKTEPHTDLLPRNQPRPSGQEGHTRWKRGGAADVMPVIGLDDASQPRAPVQSDQLVSQTARASAPEAKTDRSHIVATCRV